MRLDRIRLSQFLSHADTDWEPNGARLVSLVGPNGAGKSSLLDALAYVLFDDARGRTDELVRLGATDMSATVEFVARGERYRVTRGRTTKAGGRSYLELALRDGEAWRPLTRDTMRETQAAIEEVLRLDAATFRASALLMQGALTRFTDATAAERKRILGTVLGLDRYERAEKLARERSRDAEAAIAADRPRLAALTEALARRPELEAARAGAEIVLEGLADATERAMERRTEIEGALRDLAAELAGAEAASREAAAIAGRIEDLRTRYRRARERLGASTEALVRAQDVLAGAADVEAAAARLPELRVALERLEVAEQRSRAADREAAAWQGRYEAVRRRVDELAAGAEALTPIICAKCGFANVVDQVGLRAMLHAARAEFSALEKARPRGALFGEVKRRALVGARTALLEAERAGGRAEAIAAARETIERETQARASIEDELAAIDRDGKIAAAELAKTEGLAAGGENARARRVSLAADLVAIEREILELARRGAAGAEELGRIRATLEDLERSALERDALAAAIAAGEREAAILRRLVGAFGVGGIPARIIESVIPEWEAHANELLAELRPGMELAIRAQRTKRDRSGLIEALDLVVRDAAGERPLALFSGGERTSVALAVAVGLSRLVARRAGTAIRTLCVDEPDGLDADARRAFGAALRILAHRGDLERVVLVSHHEDLAEAADAMYRVTKNGRGSAVELVG